MKMNKVQLEKWRVCISLIDTPHVRDQYKARKIANAHTVKDINVRYRWDLLWAAVDRGYISYEELLGYNDTHIATALRSIIPPVEVAA